LHALELLVTKNDQHRQQIKTKFGGTGSKLGGGALLKLTSKKDNKLAPNTTTNKPTITTENGF
jgi:hypothetical protein